MPKGRTCSQLHEFVSDLHGLGFRVEGLGFRVLGFRASHYCAESVFDLRSWNGCSRVQANPAVIFFAFCTKLATRSCADARCFGVHALCRFARFQVFTCAGYLEAYCQR